jgi:DNA-binding IclR family transcriptional regulator
MFLQDRKLKFNIMNLDPDAVSKPTVPALIRGFAILDLLAREPGLSFTDIHTRLLLPKSSAFHLIATLCRLGVLQNRSDGRYGLGLRLAELGAAAAAQTPIGREAQPFLRSFARRAQLTCHLGVLEGHEAVYLCKEECEQEIKINNTWVGKRLALNRSALGKILLAWRPDAEVDELMPLVDWERKTPGTLCSPAVLKGDLALVRARGWATDDEEDVPNIRCVAVPVRDGAGQVIAAISAVGTILQISRPRFEILAGELLGLSAEITRNIYPAR